MRRRKLLLVFAGAATLAHASRAQQKAIPVIGFLNGGSPDANASFVAGFLQGLSETGYVEGQNVAIEYRWAGDRYDRLPALAADLVGRKVDLIATGNVPATIAAKSATSTIPIIFEVGVDPVERGLVTSFAWPGGNLTGISSLSIELTPKRVELLSELVPRADALVVPSDPLFNTHVELLVGLAARHAVPTIYAWRQFASAGGLISYGPSLPAIFRQVGNYVGQILKGAKPAELPVHQAAVFELGINLKTAQTLGLTVPQTIVAGANEVIE
jgi:putative ABC transport system substrate-binding protein